MKSLSGKKLDLVVVISLNILGFLYAYLTRSTYIGTVLFSALAVLLPSMIYLALRKRKDWRKILLFTLIVGVIGDGLTLEFYAEITRAWNAALIPSLPFKVLGVVPLDTLIAQGIICTMYIAMFYEHFLHSERSKEISHKLIFGAFFAVALSFGLFLTHSISPTTFRNLPYAYLTVGSLIVIIPVAVAFRHPTIFKRMATMGVYFFFLFLIFELIGVSYRWWIFTGSYIGWVDLLNVRFPFEEIIFWMIFYPATLISFYEIFIDDERCLSR